MKMRLNILDELQEAAKKTKQISWKIDKIVAGASVVAYELFGWHSCRSF